MKNIFILKEILLLISLINIIQNQKENITSNITNQINEIITDLDMAAGEGENDNKQINTNSKRNSENPILEINSNNIKSKEEKQDINDNVNLSNFTVYDKNKILEIMTNASFSKANDTKKDENIIDKDNITKADELENIIIQNTHEDQLAESLFYFLTFVLIIFIILFLYKFYKCYCESTIKDFGEEGTIQNPNNDPELQRISTHDEDNIMDMAENSN